MKGHLNIRNKAFTVQVTALEQTTQRGCGVPFTGDIQEQSGHNPVQCALG